MTLEGPGGVFASVKVNDIGSAPEFVTLEVIGHRVSASVQPRPGPLSPDATTKCINACQSAIRLLQKMPQSSMVLQTLAELVDAERAFTSEIAPLYGSSVSGARKSQ